MTLVTSLGLNRSICVAILLSLGTVFFLLMLNTRAAVDNSAITSDFIILVLGMLLSGIGLALGSHLVIQNHIQPSLSRLIGAAIVGGVAGALLFLLGYSLGGILAIYFHLPASEGIGFAMIFVPFWIFFSGSFAIAARYLVARLHVNQLVLALVAGALGALAGDSLMSLTLFRPTPPASPIRTPLVISATFGALMAVGLAWAERGILNSRSAPPGSPSPDDAEKP